jgi:hypothetical protein
VASAEEVGKLADKLQDPVFRRLFSVDADAALGWAELNAGEIPEGLLDTLRGLSRGELGLMARVTHELREKLSDDEWQAIAMGPL